MADTGTIGHYLNLDSTCENKKIVVIPLTIRMPNGEIITSNHTELLSKTDLPIEAHKAHIFPCLNKALLSIGNFCDRVCQAAFNDNKVLIINKGNGKIIIKGRRDPLLNLYILNLTQRNNLMTEFQTPGGCFTGSVYDFKSKGTLVDCHHASCWIPTQYGWVKAITKNFFTSWLSLSSDLVLKYLNKKQATILGHLQQPRKGLRSTHKKETQSEPEPDPELEPDQFPSSAQSVGTNIFFLKTVDLTGKFYTDQTVLFPITSRKGNKYILVAYYYDSNTIHA